MARKKDFKAAQAALDRLAVSAAELFKVTLAVQQRVDAMEKRVGMLWELHDKLVHNCSMVGIGDRADLVDQLARLDGRVNRLEHLSGDRFPLPALRPLVDPADMPGSVDVPFYTGVRSAVLDASGRLRAAKKPAGVTTKRKRAPAKPKRVRMSPELSRKLRNAARRQKRAEARVGKP
jgi:hypothetical protein